MGRKLLRLTAFLFLTSRLYGQDLTISTFSLSGSSIASNTYIYPTVVESNGGTTSAGSHSVGYYLSTDSVLNVSDTYLTYSSVSSLSAGYTTSLAPSLYIPSTVANGQYYLFAYADNTGLVSETNENNNGRAIRVTVAAPSIDLVITSPSLSATSPSSGDQLLASCSITNNGNSAASYSYVGYYLSSDAIYDVGDTYLGYISGSTLAGGTSSSRSTYVTIPSTTSSGSYYILFMADYGSYVTETNENNNISSVAITITKPNYTTVPYTGTQSITSCSTTIYDNGGPSANYSNSSSGSLTIYPSTTGSYVSLTFSSFSLESCCDYVRIYDGTSTSANLIGSYTSIPSSTIYATNTSGALTVYFYSDGSGTYSGFAATVGCVTTVPRPDLAVSSFTSTSTVVNPGYSLSPTVYVQNKGTALAASSYTGFYLSSDSVYSIGDTYLTSYSTSSLSANTGTYVYPSITIPTGTTNGQYYIIAVADYSAYVTESNENNNNRALAVTVTAPNIDLRISSFTSTTTSTTPNGYIYPTVYEYNSGTTLAGYNYIGYYLSTDSVYSVGDTYLYNSYISSLSGGTSTYATPSLTIPSTTTPGQYYIIAVADYASYVTETNENNNTRAMRITVTAPDYYLVPASGTQTITTCSTTVYDNGGSSGNYANSSYGSLTINPAVTGNYVALTFTSLSVETCCDYVRVYDGTSTSATLIGTYTSLPGSTIYATNTSGALTIYFYSDGSATYSGFSATVSCVTTVPKPDLAIGSFTSTSTVVNPGYSLSPTVYVQNKGAAMAASSYTGFYLSTDSVYSVGDTYLTSYSMGTISASSGTYLYPSITIPTGTLTGQYYIIAVSDYSSYVTESNENNNNRALAITVTAPNIDLRISSITLSSTNTIPGSYLYPYVYEYNAGSTVSGYNYIGYYLSTDSVYSVGDTYLYDSYVSSLSGNTSTYATPSLYIPTNTLPGQYYIIAIADYESYVTETNENNNTRALRITVAQPIIDLRISSFTASSTNVSSGNYFYPTVLVTNNGTNLAASSYAGFYLSTDSVFSIGDTYLSSYSSGSIDALSSVYIYPSLYIPTGTANGQYYIIAAADYSNTVSETNENNNTRALAITVSAPNVDLRISSFTSSTTSAMPGGYLYPVVYEMNTGNVSAGYNYVGYYLSTDSVYSIGDTYLTSAYVSSLSAGYTYDVSPSLYIPTGTAYGQYYIIAIADYESYVTETNENNNTRALRITVTAPNVDLRISSFTATSSTVVASSYFYPTVYEVNTGTTLAGYNYVYYYLSTDSTYSTGDTYLTYSSVSSLSGGYSTLLSPSLYIPSGTTSGQYYIIAIADYESDVAETNENNNTRALRITVTAPSIDLKISTFTASSTTLGTGTYFYPTVYEYNAGSTISGYNYVGYYLSTDSVYSIGDTYLTSSYVSSLSGGYTYDVSPSLYIPTGTAYGQYYIIAIADYESYVSETNENNNTRALRVNIAAPSVDLLISTFSTTTTSTNPGNYLYPTVFEYNAGTTTAGYNYIGYYLSTDSVYSVGDTYLTSSYISGLSGGTTTSVYPSLYIPTTTTYGQYYIIAIADYESYVTENNENNNTRSFRITVTAPNVDLRISSLTATSTTVTAASYFYPNVAEINTGTTIAGYNYVYYYLSTDSTYSTGDTYLTYSSVSSVSGGYTVYLAPSLYIPSGTTNGQYYIIAIADYEADIAETNENNNTRALRITVTAPNVDLKINSFTATSTVTGAGSYFYPTVSEWNAGQTPAGYNYIGYYLSTDSVYSIGDTYLTSTYVSTLLNGSTYVTSPSLYIPTGISYGQYYIIAIADYESYVAETNENNNTRALQITVTTPTVDLILTGLYASSGVTSGGSVTLTAYEANTGNSSASYHYIGYYLSSDSIYSIGDTFITSAYVSSVNGGSSTTSQIITTMPSGLSSGSYYIIAVDDYTGYVTETNENNNNRSVRISVIQPNVDLRISSFTSTTVSLAPGYYFYPTAVEYSAGTTSSGTHYVGYYLSTDSVYSVGDTYLTSSYISSLDPGSSTTLVPSIYIPTGTAYGQYYIIALADYSGAISETNETNNGRALRISVVAPSVDLVMGSCYTYAKTIYPGNQFSMIGSELNIGSSASSGSSSIGYYLSTDSTYSNGDTFLGYYNVGSVYPGSAYSYEYTTTLSIPTGTTSGQYYIIGYADYLNATTETKEDNNTKACKITVSTSSYVDLVIASIKGYSYYTQSTNVVTPGSYFYPSVTEANVGSASTSGIDYIGYVLSTDTVYSSNDVYLGVNYPYQSIAAGGYRNDTTELFIPQSTLPGTYYIIAIADYSKNITESNENNNTKALRVVITYGTGLEDGTISSTFSMYPNPSFGFVTLSQSDILDEVEILDLNNHSVFRKSIPASDHATLDIQSLAAGVYLVRTKKSGEILATNKLVVTK